MAKPYPPEPGDIPEVIRDSASDSSVKSVNKSWGLLGILMGLILLGGSSIWLFRSNNTEPTVTAPTDVNVEQVEPTPVPEPTAAPIENVLGHLPYEEAPASELTAITPDGRLKLRQAAAQAFRQVQADAKAQGISLVPISAFRTVKQQNQLFFEVKQKRNQEVQQRAEVSAPPGYSEHHTGYAIDIGDGTAPQTHLSANFATTPGFQWLEKNAARYSFELSFPPDNPQNVSYEPWHWRYVGDRASLELFYKARNLPSQNN